MEMSSLPVSKVLTAVGLQARGPSSKDIELTSNGLQPCRSVLGAHLRAGWLLLTPPPGWLELVEPSELDNHRNQTQSLQKVSMIWSWQAVDHPGSGCWLTN